MALTPKQEDWKKTRANLLQEKPPVLDRNVTGSSLPTNPKFIKVLLETGAHKSLTNRDEEPMDRGRLLGMMEERLRRRKINRKAPKKVNITPYEQRLKGLFGSDD